MIQHLQSKHKISPPDDSQPGEKHQLQIDQMIRKVIPHRASKQAELKQVTAEWLITDSLPFNVVQRKGYRKMIQRFDPAFIFPSNKSIKKDLAIAYQKGVLKLKELISVTCETASITTDLWTARNNDGYIGVTLHWLSSNFEIYDVILAVKRMEYPHTGERIKEYLNNKIEEFGLTGKIVCAITDNGANIKKAIKIWDSVERLPCSAHTLQLTVIQALKAIKPYTKRFRKLAKFFRSSKQSQRLDQAQIELAQRNKTDSTEKEEVDNNDLESIEETEFKILRSINDVKTRWNSTYQSWKRLLILRPAIEWLIATLHLQNDDSAKEDSYKLKSLMLEDNEWLLLNELVNILEPFDELTSYFSGIKYTTLSVINPSIEALKFEFADGSTLTSGELDKIINENEINEGKYKQLLIL